MVETREREVIYTDAPSDGPSTVLTVLFSLLVIGLLGFMIYYFSNHNMSNPTVIEHDTTTTNTVPMPTPVPTAPINITPPSTNSGSSSGSSTGSSSSTSAPVGGDSSSSSSGGSTP